MVDRPPQGSIGVGAAARVERVDAVLGMAQAASCDELGAVPSNRGLQFANARHARDQRQGIILGGHAVIDHGCVLIGNQLFALKVAFGLIETGLIDDL